MVVEVLMSQLTDFLGWKKETFAVVENLTEVVVDLNSLSVVVLSHYQSCQIDDFQMIPLDWKDHSFLIHSQVN